MLLAGCRELPGVGDWAFEVKYDTCTPSTSGMNVSELRFYRQAGIGCTLEKCARRALP
jgi:hypothetical protein